MSRGSSGAEDLKAKYEALLAKERERPEWSSQTWRQGLEANANYAGAALCSYCAVLVPIQGFAGMLMAPSIYSAAKEFAFKYDQLRNPENFYEENALKKLAEKEGGLKDDKMGWDALMGRFGNGDYADRMDEEVNHLREKLTGLGVEVGKKKLKRPHESLKDTVPLVGGFLNYVADIFLSPFGSAKKNSKGKYEGSEDQDSEQGVSASAENTIAVSSAKSPKLSVEEAAEVEKVRDQMAPGEMRDLFAGKPLTLENKALKSVACGSPESAAEVAEKMVVFCKALGIDCDKTGENGSYNLKIEMPKDWKGKAEPFTMNEAELAELKSHITTLEEVKEESVRGGEKASKSSGDKSFVADLAKKGSVQQKSSGRG